MYSFKKKSGWKFKTSANLSQSFDAAAATKGLFMLDAPGGGSVTFHYIAGGVGFSLASGLFDKKDKYTIGIGGSTEDMVNTGELWILDSFAGDELTPDDIDGACMIADISVGAGPIAGSLTGMLLGIDLVEEAQWSAKQLLTSISASRLRSSSFPANAVLWMGGESGGLQIGGGVTASMGYVWTGRHDEPPHDIEDPTVYRLEEPVRQGGHDDELILLSDALFAFGHADLLPKAKSNLTNAGHIIRARRAGRVNVIGHTDSIGSNAYNKDLSEKRAATVGNWLISQKIVNASQVKTDGYGKSRPVATNSTPRGRAKNRRVEITLFPAR